MKTLTATDLRNNLDDVMKRVSSGQELILTHRFYGSIKLSPIDRPQSSERLAGLEVFVASSKRKHNLPNKKSIKDIYDESISAKYLK